MNNKQLRMESEETEFLIKININLIWLTFAELPHIMKNREMHAYTLKKKYVLPLTNYHVELKPLTQNGLNS